MIEMNDTTILIAIVVVGLIIIKLLGKLMFRIVGVIILLIAVGIYSYYYTDFFEKHQDIAVVKKIEEKIDFLSVIDYQSKRCGRPNMTHRDSIVCECIIAPLVQDFKTNYTEEQLAALKKDKQKYRTELIAALKRNEKIIQDKLKQRNAIYIWNLMVKDLKKGILVGEK